MMPLSVGMRDGFDCDSHLAALRRCSDAEVRGNALDALGGLGDIGAPEACHVAACLRDEEWPVRLAALTVLGLLEPEAVAPHVAELVATLSDSHSSLREMGLEVLGGLGPAVSTLSETVGPITALIGDSEEAVRAAALVAIDRLGMQAAAAAALRQPVETIIGLANTQRLISDLRGGPAASANSRREGEQAELAEAAGQLAERAVGLQARRGALRREQQRDSRHPRES